MGNKSLWDMPWASFLIPTLLPFPLSISSIHFLSSLPSTVVSAVSASPIPGVMAQLTVEVGNGNEAVMTQPYSPLGMLDGTAALFFYFLLQKGVSKSPTPHFEFFTSTLKVDFGGFGLFAGAILAKSRFLEDVGT